MNRLDILKLEYLKMPQFHPIVKSVASIAHDTQTTPVLGAYCFAAYWFFAISVAVGAGVVAPPQWYFAL